MHRATGLSPPCSNRSPIARTTTARLGTGRRSPTSPSEASPECGSTSGEPGPPRASSKTSTSPRSSTTTSTCWLGLPPRTGAPAASGCGASRGEVSAPSRRRCCARPSWEPSAPSTPPTTASPATCTTPGAPCTSPNRLTGRRRWCRSTHCHPTRTSSASDGTTCGWTASSTLRSGCPRGCATSGETTTGCTARRAPTTGRSRRRRCSSAAGSTPTSKASSRCWSTSTPPAAPLSGRGVTTARLRAYRLRPATTSTSWLAGSPTISPTRRTG